MRLTTFCRRFSKAQDVTVVTIWITINKNKLITKPSEETSNTKMGFTYLDRLMVFIVSY